MYQWLNVNTYLRVNVWFFFKALNKNWAHCLENYKDVFLNRLLSIKFKKSCVHCSIMDSLKESAVHFPFD